MQPACNVHSQTVDFSQEFRKKRFKLEAKQKCEKKNSLLGVVCQEALSSHFHRSILLNVSATLDTSIIYENVGKLQREQPQECYKKCIT